MVSPRKTKVNQKAEVDFPWSSFAPGTDVTKIECERQSEYNQE